MERRGGSQRSSVVSSGQTTSDNMEDDEDDSSDEDELYLDPGEPFGAFLSPTERPYDRRERVDMLNKHLQTTTPPLRRQNSRVHIHEELNQYFYEESDSDSNMGDEHRIGRHSNHTSRPPSPRYPTVEKKRSTDGLNRPLKSAHRKGVDNQTSLNNNHDNKDKR